MCSISRHDGEIRIFARTLHALSDARSLIDLLIDGKTVEAEQFVSAKGTIHAAAPVPPVATDATADQSWAAAPIKLSLNDMRGDTSEDDDNHGSHDSSYRESSSKNRGPNQSQSRGNTRRR
jgi:hypothetical protein